MERESEWDIEGLSEREKFARWLNAEKANGLEGYHFTAGKEGEIPLDGGYVFWTRKDGTTVSEEAPSEKICEELNRVHRCIERGEVEEFRDEL